MKFLKSTMAIVALLAIGSVSAKQMGKKVAAVTTTTTPKPAPISAPSENVAKQVAIQISKMNSAANSAIEINKKATNELVNAVDKILSKQLKITLLDTAIKIQQALMDSIQNNKQALSKAKEILLLQPAAKIGYEGGSAIEEMQAPKITEEGTEFQEIKLF